MNKDETPTEEETPLPLYKQVAADCAERIKASRRIVEGTEFLGFNRADLRARGLRSERPKSVRKSIKIARHPLALLRESMSKEFPGFKHEAEPVEEPTPKVMSNERRWEIYGDDPTPAQTRRLKKKFHRSVRLTPGS
jgi:hypothetical protein